MRDGDDVVAIVVAEVVVTAGYPNEIPTFGFDQLDDLTALQISPIARRLLRPLAPTIT